MAASHTEARSFDGDLGAIREAVAAALLRLGASSVSWAPDGSQVRANSGISLESWGEQFVVAIDASGEVRVWSTCSFPVQVIDWGKNAANCRALLDGVAASLTGAASPVAAAAEWFPDPTGRHGQRFWDGARWTEHVADDGRVDCDPLGSAG